MTTRFATTMQALGLYLALCCLAAPASAADLPAEGERLPDLLLEAPTDPKLAAELGVTAGKPFGLGDLGAELVLLEVIGVYCPQCHRQLPGFNSLVGRLNKAGLWGKVVMLGLAAGGTPMEVDYLRAKGGYAFPVVPDPDYQAHKALNEPQTPFTMLVDKDGVVRFAHLGVIEDVNALFARIRELAR